MTPEEFLPSRDFSLDNGKGIHSELVCRHGTDRNKWPLGAQTVERILAPSAEGKQCQHIGVVISGRCYRCGRSWDEVADEIRYSPPPIRPPDPLREAPR